MEDYKKIEEFVAMMTETTTADEAAKAIGDEQIANIIINAYKRGVDAYKWKYLCQVDKYKNACVVFVEKMMEGK